MKDCPFCHIDHETLLANEGAYTIYDQYPVSKGHALVIPRIHVADYFDLSDKYKNHLWQLVEKTKDLLQEKYHPDGFNVGFNVNEAAGQTIFHVHVHVIPRYNGDIEDPTGGVRGVIPDKRIY